MDGKKEDGYLLGVSPRSTTPPRATLAQLAEERLGSLQYLLQSKNGVSSSPPSRNRPRASTATSTGGTGRAAGRVRRSASGNVEEAGDGSSVARSRGLFSSAPNVASRERPRSQGSSSSGRRQAGKSSSGTYRLSIDNLERAPMGSNHVDDRSPSASAWRHRPQPPASSSTGSTPERAAAEAAGLAAPRQMARGRGGSTTALSTTASAGGTPARKLSGSSIYGGSDNSRGSYGGIGILGKGSGDDSDSFFGYSDDDDDEEEVEDAEDAYHRRRRLQNSCCILVGVSWAAALLLCVCGGAAASSSAATFGAAAACALLGIVVLATLARCWGLPSWRSREQEEGDGDENEYGETSLCCLWGRGREVDEGGKLAEIGGVTYLAI